jgi:hypothetical protein
MKNDSQYNGQARTGKHEALREPDAAGKTDRPTDIRAWKYDREHRRRMAMMKKLGKVRGKLLSGILEQEVFRFSSRKKARLKVVK